MERVIADGRHLSLGGRPWRVRGATYGSFVARLDGAPFPERTQVKLDLAAMAAIGLNTVRTYTVPPADLLDVAADLDMRVIVGLDYRDWRYEHAADRAASRRVLHAGERAVDEALDRCAAHPAVLAISVGNEVPGDLVRLHGVGRVEHVLSSLAERIHGGAPDQLVTYGNFPTTEYLDIDGLDIVSFNVFLESPEKLRPYLRHLQVVARDRPLLVSELGLASAVHGEVAQAEALRWQLDVVDEVGAAGATVFAWTDEWGVDGRAVEGWGFGITTTDRDPKPALEVVGAWASRRSVRDLRSTWPTLSVVVCAYNEERTISECLESLAACDYPGLDVVVCDDGSSDATLAIAARFPFRLLRLPHGGLSAARNAGLAAATGDIVAYLDADAACHPDWPYHLALSLEDDGVVATGGPNLPFADSGLVERAVAASPGGPLEVLVSDHRAEHVPGCNMAFRREALDAIGGFDVSYTSAGDDVDVCWKLLDRGGEIAFAPAAQVRHHRRSTVRAYLRQQRGYGRAERMVAAKHPHRFNRLGQAIWHGSIYAGPTLLRTVLRPVIYHGYQGHAPYQSVLYRRAEVATAWASALLPMSLPAAAVGLVLAALWTPAALVGVALVAAAVGFYGAAVFVAATPPRAEHRRFRYRATVAWLHVAQPFVRTWGRVRYRPATSRTGPPERSWLGDRAAGLDAITSALRSRRCAVRSGRPTDAWDLEAVFGPFVSARINVAVTWSWTPHHRVSFRLRPLLWCTFGASVAVGLLAGAAGIVLAAGAALIAVGEAFSLRRAVARSVGYATRGADVPAVP